VLWALHELFPEAPIYTTIWNRLAVPRFATCDVRTTWMQRLPRIQRSPRLYAALYPLAFRRLRLNHYDLVISSTSSFAHGIRTKGAIHLSYCHSPANFVWRPRFYFDAFVVRAASLPLRAWLKAFDRRAARRPDHFVATGRTVAARITRYYRREPTIIPPPIARTWFLEHHSDDFFLFVGRLVPHKRARLAVEACAALGVPLVVAGTGRAGATLQKDAGDSTRFLGYVSDAELRVLYAHARAVLLPSEEEFGLVSLEAQAAGTPVIAYDAGGACETVVDGVTGIRFAPQTTAGLTEAIRRFDGLSWDRAAIQENAARYSEERFQRHVLALVESHLDGHASGVARVSRSLAAGTADSL